LGVTAWLAHLVAERPSLDVYVIAAGAALFPIVID
jgi:hypothetical protein